MLDRPPRFSMLPRSRKAGMVASGRLFEFSISAAQIVRAKAHILGSSAEEAYGCCLHPSGST